MKREFALLAFLTPIIFLVVTTSMKVGACEPGAKGTVVALLITNVVMTAIVCLNPTMRTKLLKKDKLDRGIYFGMALSTFAVVAAWFAPGLNLKLGVESAIASIAVWVAFFSMCCMVTAAVVSLNFLKSYFETNAKEISRIPLYASLLAASGLGYLFGSFNRPKDAKCLFVKEASHENTQKSEESTSLDSHNERSDLPTGSGSTPPPTP